MAPAISAAGIPTAARWPDTRPVTTLPSPTMAPDSNTAPFNTLARAAKKKTTVEEYVTHAVTQYLK
jgi:hypothetical protein